MPSPKITQNHPLKKPRYLALSKKLRAFVSSWLTKLNADAPHAQGVQSRPVAINRR